MTTRKSQSAPSEHQPKPQNTTKGTSPLNVVGIGASAGGLKALQAFFESLPADTGLTFVVIVHLSPEHESQLAELLQTRTEMSITQVSGRVEMEPNHVYVIPPAKRLVATDRHLDLRDFEEPRGQRMPIDDFFRSFAEHHSDGTAIILSGTGSDGAVGIRGIKEGGGLLMAQEPNEAEYDGMPRSAIATGLVDVVAPVRELVTTLVRYKQNGVSLQLPSEPAALPEDGQSALEQILSHLQMETGHGFSRYKRSTLLRRLRRRMQLRQTHSLSAHLDLLRQDDDEVEALFRDLLISVTRFFRDAEVFDVLAEQLIPEIFARKEQGEDIRVWVAGCATGEEAYSLAILLQEQAARLNHPPAYKIFATDLDPHALQVARNGRYPEAIAADVSEERLKRFFRKENDHYRVRRELRERMVFARHNLLQDPPFSHLDLLTCRNLLIYLQRELQEQLSQVFAYALRPGGTLFLGSAESLSAETELFATVDKSLSLYRRQAGEIRTPLLPTLAFSPVPEMTLPDGEPATPGPARDPATLHRQMLEDYAPPSLLVDADYKAVHLSERAGRYLQPQGGTVTNDLMRLVRPDLQTELLAALQRAFDEGEATVARPVRVQFNGAPQVVYLTVRPRPRREVDAGTQLALVIFNEDERAAETEAGEDVERAGEAPEVEVKRLEKELRHARRRLERMRHEFTSSEQELHAANEELQSINEEYKSTLEELEASKEELQSINEELQSTNQELEQKIEQLRQAHSDLENLFAATNIATLFLDRKLRIRRYTPRVEELFTLRPDDQGRPIGDLRITVDYEQLEADAHAVLDELVPIEREVHDDDASYLVRARPYRSLDDKIDGVVFTFVDITERTQMEEELRQAKEYAEAIVDTVREGLLILEPDLTVQFANESFYEIFDVDAKETIGEFIYDLGNGAWDTPELRTLLEEILPQPQIFNDYRVEHEFEDIGRRVLLLNARRLDHVDLILLAIEDITEREVYELALRESEERFRVLVEATAQAVWETNAEGEVVSDSPSWRRYTGQTLEERLGYGWVDAVHPEDREYAERQWYEAVRDEIQVDAEFRLQRADGSWRWTNVRAAPLRTPDGSVRKWVGMNIDITERKRAEEALRQLTETLEEQVQVRTEQLQELAVRLTRAEQAERHRISQVLHDDLQQWLYSVQLSLEMIRDAVRDERHDADVLLQRLDSASEKVKEATRRTRRLSVELSPPILEGDGLTEAFGWLATQMQDQHNLTVEVDAEGSFHVPDQDLRVLLFQSVRELLFNVVKHAGVSHATVQMRWEDGELRMQVSDEGAGFDTEAVMHETPSGWGLANVRERLELVGGRMEVASGPSEGTWITLCAPVERSSTTED